MSGLKDLVSMLDDRGTEDEVEVFADSVRQGLDLAARNLGVPVDDLDYEVIEKGTKGFFGVGRLPYKMIVRPILSHKELDEFSQIGKKLSAHGSTELDFKPPEPLDKDGSFVLRMTKTGLWLTINPPKGVGKPVEVNEVSGKLYSMRFGNPDLKLIDKEVRKASGSPVRIGSWSPNAEYDGSCHVEVTADEMKVYVHFTPPRFTGRHMEFDDVIDALRSADVVFGINEKKINEYLDMMNYSQPLVAAEGTMQRNGKDAYVDFKVKINSAIDFSRFDGNIDFKELNLIENVVVGQLLAVKVPAEKGIQGRTVNNRILPTRSGRDTQIKHGDGTILSDNGLELTAEKNGQVVIKAGKICVEDVYIVKGDVDNNVGNIVMLGSVLVTGSVLDNFTVKASGNIEVHGTVQKAFLEAEGDIIVRQGINGRDEAKIETTGGSVYTKMVHSARIIAEKNVVVAEEILHSRVDAGKLVFCNGKRAQIVAGVIRAGDEINARSIGAESYTKTELWVGMNPKVLQQLTDLQNHLIKTREEKESLDKDVQTLLNKKRAGSLPKDQNERLDALTARKDKLDKREAEVTIELDELKAYLDMLEQNGRVSVEKTLYPGCEIYIKDQKFSVKDEYPNACITLEGGQWKFSAYQRPVEDQSMLSIRRPQRRK